MQMIRAFDDLACKSGKSSCRVTIWFPGTLYSWSREWCIDCYRGICIILLELEDILLELLIAASEDFVRLADLCIVRSCIINVHQRYTSLPERRTSTSPDQRSGKLNITLSSHPYWSCIRILQTFNSSSNLSYRVILMDDTSTFALIPTALVVEIGIVSSKWFYHWTCVSPNVRW